MEIAGQNLTFFWQFTQVGRSHANVPGPRFILLALFAFSARAQHLPPKASSNAAQPTRIVQSTLVMPALPAPVDATALALIRKAMATMSPNIVINDVTLTGTATRTAGSDVETGTITMKALGNRFSRIDLASGSGNRTELRGENSSGKPQNLSIAPDGASVKIAGHNAMTDAV